MTIETSMHNVVSVEQRSTKIDGTNGIFYTLDILATDKDGVQFSMRLFSESPLKIEKVKA